MIGTRIQAVKSFTSLPPYPTFEQDDIAVVIKNIPNNSRHVIIYLLNKHDVMPFWKGWLLDTKYIRIL